MRYLDCTFLAPEENLACDEALLDQSERGESAELLRVWQPAQYFVVVGYANRVQEEVNVSACEAAGIPIFRRCSGGGTVLQGPGVLNYSVILEIGAAPERASISATNQLVMERHRGLLEKLLGRRVDIAGHTDLAINGIKCSGNAQRRKHRFLLFHGAFLLGLDVSLVEKCLRFPTKQPDYRNDRAHSDFMANISVSALGLINALRDTWNARELAGSPPAQAISDLTRTKYATKEWNYKF